MTYAQTYRNLSDLLQSAPMRERLFSKTCQDLHEYFISAAVSSPAWSRSGTSAEEAIFGWILPGNYTLDELQDRFAPRLQDDPGTPDPMYQVISRTVIECVSTMLKDTFTLPEHAVLLKNSETAGLEMGAIYTSLRKTVNFKFCAQLAKEVGATTVALTPEYLRDAGVLRTMGAVIEAQEREHLRRSTNASKDRYVQLLKKWQTYSGDIHGVHISVESPLAAELMVWLQSLTHADASTFLTHHHVSARSVAVDELPADFLYAMAQSLDATLPPPSPMLFAKTRELLGDILAIRGYRRLTISTEDGKFARVDIDQFNRVGGVHEHLGLFVNLLLKGLSAQAGVMVRAFQEDTINIFVPEKGAFAPVGLKNMYGAVLEHGKVIGLTARQVEGSLTMNGRTGKPNKREPSIRCFDWPGANPTPATGAKPGHLGQA